MPYDPQLLASILCIQNLRDTGAKIKELKLEKKELRSLLDEKKLVEEKTHRNQASEIECLKEDLHQLSQVRSLVLLYVY